MARRQLVQWTRQTAESQDVWSSSSDRSLHIWLRRSPVDSDGMPTGFVDRLLPVVTMAILVISGLIIGWVLFVP